MSAGKSAPGHHAARLAEWERQADLDAALVQELSRFPARPRGNLVGREGAACALGEWLEPKEGVGEEASKRSALARLRALANVHNYPSAGTPQTAPRKAPQPGAVFAWDMDDDADARARQIITATASAAGLYSNGRGNRVAHARLGAMVRAIEAMSAAGVAPPNPTITNDHLRCPEFVDALTDYTGGKASVALRARLTREQLEAAALPAAELRTLSRAARHYIVEALQARATAGLSK